MEEGEKAGGEMDGGGEMKGWLEEGKEEGDGLRYCSLKVCRQIDER